MFGFYIPCYLVNWLVMYILCQVRKKNDYITWWDWKSSCHSTQRHYFRVLRGFCKWCDDDYFVKKWYVFGATMRLCTLLVSPKRFWLLKWFVVRRSQKNSTTKSRSTSYLFITRNLLILRLLDPFCIMTTSERVQRCRGTPVDVAELMIVLLYGEHCCIEIC